MPAVAVDAQDAAHFIIASGEQDPVADTRCVSASLRCGNIHFHTTFDGGKTWTSGTVQRAAPTDPGHPSEEAMEADDAKVGFLADGSILLEAQGTSQLAIGGAIQTLYAARSTDGGRSFPQVSVIARGSGLATGVPGTNAADFHQPEEESFAQLADGSILTIWNDLGFDFAGKVSVQPMWATSRDLGVTWTAPTSIKEAGNPTYAEDLVVTPAGTWIVALIELREPEVGHDPGNWYAAMARSPDRGATWQRTEIGPSVWFPTLAQTQNDIVLFYGANDTAANTMTPKAVISTDDGRTLGQPLALDAPAPRTAWAGMAAGGDAAYLVYVVRGSDDASSEIRAVAEKDGRVLPAITLEGSIPLAPSEIIYYLGIGRMPSGGAIAAWPSDAKSNGLKWSQITI